ncbi:unnamed protein product [Sphagnum balticum]
MTLTCSLPLLPPPLAQPPARFQSPIAVESARRGEKPWEAGEEFCGLGECIVQVVGGSGSSGSLGILRLVMFGVYTGRGEGEEGERCGLLGYLHGSCSQTSQNSSRSAETHLPPTTSSWETTSIGVPPFIRRPPRRGGRFPATSPQNQIPKKNHPAAGKPRIPHRYSQLRILRRVQPQIRERGGLESIHGNLRLPPPDRTHPELNPLHARRTLSQLRLHRRHRQSPAHGGNTQFQLSDGRPALERPQRGRKARLPRQPSRIGLPLRAGYFGGVLPQQQLEADREGPPTYDERTIQVIQGY